MRITNPPCVIALAGPNGAGKSTAGPALLKGALRVTEFVNADIIALRNFFSVYRPLAASWRVYDNSSGLVPRLIAAGRRTVVTRVKDKQTWKQIMKEAQK